MLRQHPVSAPLKILSCETFRWRSHFCHMIIVKQPRHYLHYERAKRFAREVKR